VVPRKPRFYLPGVPVHVVQRGNNCQPIFFESDDYRAYLEWLHEALKRYGCALHAYVLMTNHVHLLLSPETRHGVSRLIQYVGRYYVPYINCAYGRSGTLWEGRYKANLLQDERYLLACMRYIELNPVRAGMVKSAAHHRWSSYRANAQGKEDALITTHARYRALGRSRAAAREAYRALFKERIDSELIEDIRAAWQSGTPLGNDRFREAIESALKTKVGYARQGRPRRGGND
jgi:putative transposase